MTKEDTKFMKLALEKATLTLTKGDFPVGAALVINGKLIDTAGNLISTNSDWISHAEMLLLIKHSSLIKESRKRNESVDIYTTLEPCIMCLGASILHRVTRIVYACQDNFTGATNLNLESLPVGYENMRTKIEGGLLKKESQKLLLDYMNKQDSAKWKKAGELMKNVE